MQVSRSQWPFGLGRGSGAVGLLGLWVRFPQGSRMSVSCQYYVLPEVLATGRSPVQRSPTDCGVSECDREASTMRRSWPTMGCEAIQKNIYIFIYIQGAAFNVTHFESRITHLLYTAINTTEHGQVSQCLVFTKSLTSSIQRLGDVLHDNQDISAISQVHLP